MNIYTNMSDFFFQLSFKKCNILDEYIYTYLFAIPFTTLNNIFYNKDRC